MPRKQLLLFGIIFLEGYVVLATELLAIRILVPFVGSGIEVVSIIISAVLLPLAVGYWMGGRKRIKHPASIRSVLQQNLFVALVILSIGLSYVPQGAFFLFLMAVGLKHRIVQTACYAVLFLVFPVFLLAQTVPLVSNYFGRTRLSEITGRMLFFSTTGSFLGSVISTLVLMIVIGVHNTVTITMALIALLIMAVSPRGGYFITVLAGLTVAAVWLVNSNETMKSLNIVANTPYSLVGVSALPGENARTLQINHSWSSRFSADKTKRSAYIQYVEKNFIFPIDATKKRSILVLGAGGFVVGWDDKNNNYTFVDIDRQLKDIAEQYFLPGPLSSNKHFEATSARAFLHQTQEKYDLVIVDLYSNVMSIPAEAVTREFLRDVKNVIKPEGMLVANVISSPTFDDRFSVRYFNTFASVFPAFTRQVIGDFNGAKNNNVLNVLYIYYNKQINDNDHAIYTDDKNSYSLDH